jgi:glucokinase
MNDWRLVADVGGTNVRFAKADASASLHRTDSFSIASYPTFANALQAYLDKTGGSSGCRDAIVGAAGPAEDNAVTLTNHESWTIRGAEVGAMLAGAPALVVNDLQAVAAALPHLTAQDLSAIGTPGPPEAPTKPMLALNVGTGLGAAVAARYAGVWYTAAAEPGHMSLPPVGLVHRSSATEQTSIEDVLSGRGMTRLYAELTGDATPRDAAQILSSADIDFHAAALVEMLTDLLGRFAGDLVLATGAWGGVYLCGSVAVGLSHRADPTRFRKAFEAKGAMSERMQQVPTLVIGRPDVALFGLARYQLPAKTS